MVPEVGRHGDDQPIYKDRGALRWCLTDPTKNDTNPSGWQHSVHNMINVRTILDNNTEISDDIFPRVVFLLHWPFLFGLQFHGWPFIFGTTSAAWSMIWPSLRCQKIVQILSGILYSPLYFACGTPQVVLWRRRTLGFLVVCGKQRFQTCKRGFEMPLLPTWSKRWILIWLSLKALLTSKVRVEYGIPIQKTTFQIAFFVS